MSYQVRTINYRFSNTGFGFQRLGLCYLNQVVLSGTGDRNTQQRWIISQLSKSPQVHFVQHPSPPCRTFTAEKVACTVQVSARSLPLSRSSCTGNDPPPVYLTIHVRILQGWHLAPIQMRTVSALRCRPCLDGGFITAASSAPPEFRSCQQHYIPSAESVNTGQGNKNYTRRIEHFHQQGNVQVSLTPSFPPSFH